MLFSGTPKWPYVPSLKRVTSVNCAPAELLDALFGDAKVAQLFLDHCDFVLELPQLALVFVLFLHPKSEGLLAFGQRLLAAHFFLTF